MSFLGCGQNYRPVVSAINPVGPALQPTKYAVAISSPSPTLNGLLTIVDVSGDTIEATPEITPLGNNPSPLFYTQLANDAEGFAINGQTALSTVPIGSPMTLLTTSVIQTTLPTATTTTGVNLPSVSAFTLASTPRLLIPEIAQSAVAVLSTASPALQQQITVGANPIYVVGVDNTPRAYAISDLNPGGNGQVSAIEGSSLSVSATIPVGVNPVYGVETADVRRAFILNKGSGTVSVINVTNNALDDFKATISLPAPSGIPATVPASPVWADLTAATNEMVVLNQADGVNPGWLSIVGIPLCNASYDPNPPDQTTTPTAPSCDPTNPTDASDFGTVVATVPVGINPSMVSVLADGTQAYVVNSGNATNPGSVTVINLISGTVTATIPAAFASNANLTPTCPATVASAGCIYGHPNTVSATTGTPTGKVYITAPDSTYMTVLETDTDVVDTHIDLQGTGVRVRVSAP